MGEIGSTRPSSINRLTSSYSAAISLACSAEKRARPWQFGQVKTDEAGSSPARGISQLSVHSQVTVIDMLNRSLMLALNLWKHISNTL